jgi:hypothetical protein
MMKRNLETNKEKGADRYTSGLGWRSFLGPNNETTREDGGKSKN